MDILNIQLPIAGLEFNVLLLITIGFIVGVLGGFFGVGGGWIITPALNIFGFHMDYAIGTGLSQIFGTSIAGTRKLSRIGIFDWKLVFISIIGSVTGVELARIVMLLESYGEAGKIIRYTYIVFLLGLCTFMLYDYFILRHKHSKISNTTKNRNNGEGEPKENISPIAKRLYSLKIPPMVSFKTSGIESVSLWVVIFIFLFTGFLSGFLGIGGSFIRMPCLVYLIGCPMIIAVGTDLINVVFTSGFGCFTYALKGRVEVIAAMYMFIGAVIGSQFGVAAIKYIRGYKIRMMFAVMIFLTAISVILEQTYRSTNIKLLDIFSVYFILGSAGLLCAYILVRLIHLFRKSKK